MTELPKLKNSRSVSSNGSWTVGELSDPNALPTAPGAKREEEAPAGVGIVAPSKEVYILTPKDANKNREVESITLTRLSDHGSFPLSELPEGVRKVAVEKLESVAKENGRTGLTAAVTERFLAAQDVGLADSKAEATVNQIIGNILKTDGKAYYEEKAEALLDAAIDQKSPELAAQSKAATAQAKANEEAGEDRSLSVGNPRRTHAEQADIEALATSRWASRVTEQKSNPDKGQSR